MQPKYSLEDYIYQMECRSTEPSVDPDELDVYAQLQQKEKDLILAAELGKALLEKNEELSRQNEKIAEDYSQKLEVSERSVTGAVTSVMHGNYWRLGSSLRFKRWRFAVLRAFMAYVRMEGSFDRLLD